MMYTLRFDVETLIIATIGSVIVADVSCGLM